MFGASIGGFADRSIKLQGHFKSLSWPRRAHSLPDVDHALVHIKHNHPSAGWLVYASSLLCCSNKRGLHLGTRVCIAKITPASI